MALNNILHKITTKIAILLTIASLLSVSQGIIICFEPNNNYKLEFKVAPCNIRTKTIKASVKDKNISLLQNQTCTDYELNLALNLENTSKNLIFYSVNYANSIFEYSFDKLLVKGKKFKAPIQLPVSKHLSTVILLI